MSNERVAVVTGTSTGFGHEIVKKLAAEGYVVHATMRDVSGRNAEPARALEALGAHVVELDVSDDASVERAAAKVAALSPHVDVLVNNAGTAFFGPVEAFTPVAVERQFASNVFGPLRVSRAFLPGMRARGSGLVVFVSSVVGRFLLPYAGVYSASKWALEALAETLSYELRPFGVDVTLLEPGAYKTNITSARETPDDTARFESYGALASSTLDAIGDALAASAREPHEVADAVAELATTAPGRRPLRRVVPPGSPAEAINDAVEPVQRGVLEAFGLAAFLPPSPAHAASAGAAAS